MKTFKTIAIIALIISFSSLAFAWGIWGHKHINKSAVFALPESMRVFFYNHIDFVTQESAIPDIRKYTINDKAEGPRHYIDIEAFPVSIDSLPQSSKEAAAKYPDSILRKNGFLPWYIQDMMTKLTVAFKEKKTTEILFLAADLGHYLGDAHMPLHTSLNHDGQFTHQNGIHSFWESQLPEQFGDRFNFCTADAKYITDVKKETWRIIKHTHLLVDTLLTIERKIKSTFPEDKIYMKNDKGGILKNKYNSPVHTLEYARAYHEALKGMVEKQMRSSITATADFWYTAWVNAGKPDLTSLDDEDLTKQNKKYYIEDYKAWKNGKLTKLKIEGEF
jgi:hypothetical protein